MAEAELFARPGRLLVPTSACQAGRSRRPNTIDVYGCRYDVEATCGAENHTSPSPLLFDSRCGGLPRQPGSDATGGASRSPGPGSQRCLWPCSEQSSGSPLRSFGKLSLGRDSLWRRSWNTLVVAADGPGHAATFRLSCFCICLSCILWSAAERLVPRECVGPSEVSVVLISPLTVTWPSCVGVTMWTASAPRWRRFVLRGS